MKISQYDSILLSSITSSDLLYIIDSNEVDSKLSSKNMTYATLLSALNRDLEQVQVVDDVEYKSTEKKLYIYVKLTDGTRKTISIPMEELNIYSVADGLSNYNGNDNIFSVDWTKVYHKNELSNADQVSSALSNSDNWNTAYEKTKNATNLISCEVDNVTLSVIDNQLSCIKSGSGGSNAIFRIWN